MTTKDSSLYGIPRPKISSSKEISSSTTLAFTSQLTSLIASSTSTSASSNRPSAGRTRPKKDDIFATHNKGSRKRGLKDLDDVSFDQHHSTTSEALDAATHHRAKRKMEEKARLYAAMKRGDIEDADEKYAVDFDRKWAEAQERGGGSDNATSSDDDDDQSEAEAEMVEYTDEFGRTRRGTRADAVREERRKKAAAAAADEPDRFTARPAAPANLIYGDTVQAAAFNPDVSIAEQMAALAAKRDKAVTPPPEEHFDASKEIRTKGTGFYQFSVDEETRKREMEGLEAEREETERVRAERDKRKEDRKKEVEEKRRAIREKRGKAQADRFLDSLGDALG